MSRLGLTRLTILAAAVCRLTMSIPAEELVVWHAYRGTEKDAFEKLVGQFNASPGARGVKVRSSR